MPFDFDKDAEKFIDHCLTPYIYMCVNSKWISDINVRGEGIKLLKENTRVNHDLGFQSE